MKILYVIPSYEPAWAFGGTVTATSQLCRGLVGREIDVTVYTTDADGKGGYLDVPLNTPVDLGGVKVWYFHCDFLPKKAFHSKALSKKLEETIEGFDLIHISAVWQWIQVSVSRICRKFAVPYVISPHGSFKTWEWNQNVIKKRPFWHLFGKRATKKATAIHFTAESEREESVSNLPLLSKIPSFVAPNGIEIPNKNKCQRKEGFLNIPLDKFVILFLGRVHRKKGIDFALKALGSIKNKNYCFLIVGPEEDKEHCNYLRQLSRRLGIEKQIIWYGSIKKDEAQNFYCNSDLMVLTSHSENFGMTVVEAMSCGLPVFISKNVSIWREVVADNAGLAVELNENAIAKEFKKVFTNPSLLKEMSKNSAESAKKRYNINKVTSLMARAYEDILTGERSPELKWK